MRDTVLHGYHLKYLLGKGGMAEVWYAENTIGRKAAIKIMHTKFVEEEQVKIRFETEAKTMIQLDHPNIRQVLDYGEYGGLPFIIMEYLEGETLGHSQAKGRSFSDAEFGRWWKQALSALEHTHNRGIIHRDIKPSNIFLQDSGDIKILDFGIAKVRHEISMTMTGQGLGTILYMSPEQIRDPKRVTSATDIYSLTVTFATLIKGRSIISNTDEDSGFEIQMKIVQGDLELDSIPENWLNILKPGLEKEPNKRLSARNALKYFDTLFRKNNDEETVVSKMNHKVNVFSYQKTKVNEDKTKADSSIKCKWLNFCKCIDKILRLGF